jgi:hypothetical protein
VIALGFGIMWLGYLQGMYGWTLLKGWDIPWHSLADPIHPYQWPASGSPPLIPKGQVLPSSGSSSGSSAATAAGAGLA